MREKIILTDIDECSEDACSSVENSVCANTKGSYKCECGKKGFRRSDDESTCEGKMKNYILEGLRHET